MKRQTVLMKWIVTCLPVLAFAAAVFSLSGCGSDAGADDERPKVVATTTMIEDLARVIGGEEVNVIGIMRSGEDPHLYEVKPKDATTIREADLVLYNGLYLEATLESIIEEQARGKVAALAEQDGIDSLKVKEGLEVVADPHCWMDVALYKLYAEQARDALTEIAPEHEDLFKERTAAYLKELDELDAWVREQIATIPKKQRVLVSAHDAFKYYGEAYGVEVHGLVGNSTEAQMLPGDIQRIEALIRSTGLRSIFVESSTEGVLNDQVRQIAERTGIVVSKQKLHSDSLDAPDKPAGTYLGMMRHNTETIVQALKGES